MKRNESAVRALSPVAGLARHETGASNTAARRDLTRAVAVVTAIAALGVLLRWSLIQGGLSRPVGLNIFYRLYALYELPHLVLLAAFAAFTAALLARGHRGIEAGASPRASVFAQRWTWLVALALVLAGVLITHLVMHDLLFSMDEFSADFQARAFARGEIAPAISWPWRSLKDAIVPIFVQLDEANGRWMSQYLPVYAALKAPFVVLHIESWLNPLLTAAGCFPLVVVARKMWPDDRGRPLIALALFATSSQILLTSGTGYSMPAHLLLNLVWLSLYLRGDIRSWWLALLVGALAMGLHNPFPHALFVAPFLLRLLRERRWSRVVTAAVAYASAAGAWLAWMMHTHPATAAPDSGLLHVFAMPDVGSVALQIMNISLVLTWTAPILGPLVIALVLHPRRLDSLQSDLALGVLLTFLFFVFFPTTQGHGWGYRYVHQVLGNLCLLGAGGIGTVTAAIGARRTRAWLSAGFATATVVQLPLRLHDTEQFVRPFALGHEYVRSRNATIVLVDGESVWYGRDLIRNDPFLRLPVVARRQRLSPGFIEQMRRAFPGGVLELSDDELLKLGMTRSERWVSLGEASERRNAASPAR
jgi:hypothetical protein